MQYSLFTMTSLALFSV